MKADKEIIRALNAVLSQSLIAINQYFLHARIVKNWGMERLNDAFFQQSLQEMRWADMLIARILLLEGLPNLQELGKLRIGESVNEMLLCDLHLERHKHQLLVQAMALCESKQDFVSRELLAVLKDGNESYVDWLTTQMEQSERMGDKNYIQSMV